MLFHVASLDEIGPRYTHAQTWALAQSSPTGTTTKYEPISNFYILLPNSWRALFHLFLLLFVLQPFLFKAVSAAMINDDKRLSDLFCIRLYSSFSTATFWILFFLIPCENRVSSQSPEHCFLQQSPPLTILWPKSTRKKDMWDNYRTPVPNWCWDRPMMADVHLHSNQVSNVLGQFSLSLAIQRNAKNCTKQSKFCSRVTAGISSIWVW